MSNTTDKMNFLFVTDENFAEICTVAMYSVAEHNDGAVFYVINDGMRDDTICKMKASLQNLNCRIVFVDTIDIVNKFEINVNPGIWPINCLQRLFICDRIPESVKRILYLDCDILVRKSLKQLYDIEFGDEYCAAIPDCLSRLCKSNIGINENDIYYNSGVLLINLEKWRKMNVEKLFVASMQEHKGRLQYPDQDLINMVFQNKIFRVNAKYNVTSYEYGYSYEELMYYHNAEDYIDKNEFVTAKKDPYIFHFTNDVRIIRPWYKNSNHPFFEEWNSIRNKTLWGCEPLRENAVNRSLMIKHLGFKILPKKVLLYFARKLNQKHALQYSNKD